MGVDSNPPPCSDLMTEEKIYEAIRKSDGSLLKPLVLRDLQRAGGEGSASGQHI